MKFKIALAIIGLVLILGCGLRGRHLVVDKHYYPPYVSTGYMPINSGGVTIYQYYTRQNPAHYTIVVKGSPWDREVEVDHSTWQRATVGEVMDFN